MDTILELSRSRRAGARLVVTGCLAERYGDELAAAMPEVDLVAGFGESVIPELTWGPEPHQGASRRADAPPGSGVRPPRAARPMASAPWAYVKIAEGCDRRCAYCAIPSFRGAQRSRTVDAVLEEMDALGPAIAEVVLVAQDLASFGLAIVPARGIAT